MTATDVSITLVLVWLLVIVLRRGFSRQTTGQRYKGSELQSADIAKAIRRVQRGRS